MASQAATTEDTHSYYPSSSWAQPSVETPPISGTTTPSASAAHPASPWSAPNATSHSASDAANAHAAASHQIDFWPLLFPHHASLYQAQLLHYSNLVSPGRGGGLQQQAHQSPSSNNVAASLTNHQTPSRSRASSKVSNKEHSASKGTEKHGNKAAHSKEKGDRAVIAAAKEAPSNMPNHKQSQNSGQQSRQGQQQQQTESTTTSTLPARPPRSAAKQASQPHSSSVPSTPQQHARNFSYESREPSPTHNANHSPRSAYSETNSALPSLRPLPLQGCPFETAQVRFRRRMPYNIGSGSLEKVESSSIKAKLSEQHEKKLTTDMHELYDRLLPTEKVEDNRKKLCAKLEKIFNDEWPGHNIRVHLFGSSGNLLCSDDSDVDICITTPWKELEGVCMIAELLQRKGMKKVVCISAAKVPIVKIWDPELGLACDMNVNNTLALENTRMVRTYIEIDPRVRPLAMIVKYWTRKRELNDAAFGSTLSSYTWICMIIAFLQLREPPVVPPLHQRQHLKRPRKAGEADSSFADDVDKLRGFGDKNKSTLGELLFQFFRYFAHEFDYEKHVLSVRQGKKLNKADKKWMHNLCVEEPFNVGRNLGNTADEYSFRGLHIELRRAFDFIAEAKLEECCEQYVFPKEEAPTFIRPPVASRPVVIRSSSGQGGRGGRNNFRGGRHSNNYRNGNSNRRASSSVAYDTNTMYMPPVTMTPQELAWYAQQQQQQQQQQQSAGLQYPSMLYTQAQLYTQMQAQMAAQYVHQQRAAASTSQPSQGQQGQQHQQGGSTERSRTNSFDNPPLSAPLANPEWYALYGVPYQAFYTQGGYTYPSSPASTAAATTSQSEYRRSLQRSPLSTDNGAQAAGSSLRSQSQPASRSGVNAQQGQPYSGSMPQANGLVGSRQVNGVPIPNFMPDDGEIDTAPQRPISDSPASDDGPSAYVGYYVTDASSPNRRTQQGHPSGLAFGDLSQSAQGRNRRLSTDQLPQTLLDRRMRRASRSPSPLGHGRAFSVGTAANPGPSALASGNNGTRSAARPLVVNGTGSSALRTSSTPSQGHGSGLSPPDDLSRPSQDNPLQIQGHGFSSHPVGSVDSQSSSNSDVFTPQSFVTERTGPVIVNGSTSAPSAPSSNAGSIQGQGGVQPSDDPSFRDRIMSHHLAASQALLQQDFRFPSPGGRRAAQNGVIAPLDLAMGGSRVNGHGLSVDAQHLSPVYETRSPSPTIKKGELVMQSKTMRSSNLAEDAKSARTADTKTPSAMEAKPSPSHTAKLNGVRENGHVRSAKSESHGADGGWQQAPTKGRKKGTEARASGSGSSEQPPQHEADRKGG